MTMSNHLTQAIDKEGNSVFLPTILYTGLTEEGLEYETWGIISSELFCPSVTCKRQHTTQPNFPASLAYSYCDTCDEVGFTDSRMHNQDIPFTEYLGVYPKDV